MISVFEALDHLFALVSPLDVEDVPLRQAAVRFLAGELKARRTQPPFDASSMDGYALKSAEVEKDALFKVIGEAAAGHGFDGKVGPGQAVRIFTGAPMPEGADFVLIQEDAQRKGGLITVTADKISKSNVRKAGSDFAKGDTFKPSGPLNARDIALLAAMNHAHVPVRRKPVVALIATGDELVQPGETPGPDQIIASNSYGLAALLEEAGAETRLLPIAKDTPESLKLAFDLASGADLVLTIGGASVGDHDLVATVAQELGMVRSFYKIAMRPGKPLMAGQLGNAPMIGLPGNPVSAMVCGVIFILPMIRVMQGLAAEPAPRVTAKLSHVLPANGPREHYMRAKLSDGHAKVYEQQDSAMLGILSDANALAIIPPHAPEAPMGTQLEFILI